MSVANIEDDVTHTICSVALELRDELENGKLMLCKSKSMIVSNREGLAKRVQRILKVNDLHLPVADDARDLDIDAAREGRDDAKPVTKGSAQDVREKGKNVGTGHVWISQTTRLACEERLAW